MVGPIYNSGLADAYKCRYLLTNRFPAGVIQRRCTFQYLLICCPENIKIWKNPQIKGKKDWVTSYWLKIFHFFVATIKSLNLRSYLSLLEISSSLSKINTKINNTASAL